MRWTHLVPECPSIPLEKRGGKNRGTETAMPKQTARIGSHKKVMKGETEKDVGKAESLGEELKKAEKVD